MKNISGIRPFGEKNTELFYNKRMTKEEEIIFNFITNSADNILSDRVTIQMNVLKKILRVESVEKLKLLLNRLLEKQLIYTTYKFEEVDRSGAFSLLSSYEISEKELKIIFTNEFKSIFKKGSYFNNYDFDIFVFLRNSYSIEIYNLLKVNLVLSKSVEVSLKKLKKLLDIEESYGRFYDFEKKVLKPTVESIERIIRKKIIYTKIKNKDSLNSKVIGLKFSVEESNSEERIQSTNKLVKHMEEYIQAERTVIWNEVFNLLGEKDYEYIEKNIRYSIDHHRGASFSNFLLESFRLDYYNTRYKSKVNEYELNHKKINSSEKTYVSVDKMYSDIFRIVTSFKFHYLTLTPSFLKPLNSLRKVKELEYIDDTYAVFIEYNEGSPSYIDIYEI